MYQPRLVDEVTENSAGLPPGQLGTVVNAIDPQVKRTTGLTPDARDAIEAGLTGLWPTRAALPTGSSAIMPASRSSGRPRTAQRTTDQDTSWFAAITNPDNDPALPQYT